VTLLEAAALGLLQGFTEFLPVSSSGHLVIGQAFLGVRQPDITFEVIVHFGTLLAVLTALRQRVWQLVRGCALRDREAWRLALALCAGTVPAAAIGLLFKDTVTGAFSDPSAACGWLVVTGAILWSTRGRQGCRSRISQTDAFWVGFSQAFAVLPGVSRSGITISAGLWRGLDRSEAATFSFLLSIPVILGGTVMEVGPMFQRPPAVSELLSLSVGAVAAYASGVVAIRWLLAVLKGGRLDRFAYYCWAVGILGLIWFVGHNG